eukprot:2942240-Pyramimonas_sp.AAC.2
MRLVLFAPLFQWASGQQTAYELQCKAPTRQPLVSFHSNMARAGSHFAGRLLPQERFWPDLLEPMLNQIVKDNIQYYLDLYRPSMVSKLEMHTFEVRRHAPQLACLPPLLPAHAFASSNQAP